MMGETNADRRTLSRKKRVLSPAELKTEAAWRTWGWSGIIVALFGLVIPNVLFWPLNLHKITSDSQYDYEGFLSNAAVYVGVVMTAQIVALKCGFEARKIVAGKVATGFAIVIFCSAFLFFLGTFFLCTLAAA